MPINLTITASDVQEFDELIARFARSGAVAVRASTPEITHIPAALEAATKGNARSRKTKETGDGATAAPAAAATEASPATAAAVDPFAASGAAEATSAAPSTAETTATPAATSPADQAAADAGEVTIQQLKYAMTDLLKAKSASFAMQTLEQATGCRSLTSGSPNVVEKAKDDPTIMRRTLDALVAAKSAA